MTEHPILFSGEMIRAILDGSKTQTRRVIKPQPRLADTVSDLADWRGAQIAAYLLRDGERPIKCPFGVPGDTLWVRETWQAWQGGGTDCDWDVWEGPIAHAEGCTDIEYKATSDSCGPWRPSTHMPRWACRLRLRVEGVWVERVQDITEADAKAEGVDAISMADKPRQATWSRRQDFAQLWDKINLRRKAGWATNPWVWVVTFSRIDSAEEDGGEGATDD